MFKFRIQNAPVSFYIVATGFLTLLIYLLLSLAAPLSLKALAISLGVALMFTTSVFETQRKFIEHYSEKYILIPLALCTLLILLSWYFWALSLPSGWIHIAATIASVFVILVWILPDPGPMSWEPRKPLEDDDKRKDGYTHNHDTTQTTDSGYGGKP